MDSKKLVKKEILLKKIQEYFAKNPSKNSAIFKAEAGGNVYWKVQKGKKGFAVTEVSTAKSSYTLTEAGPLPDPDNKLNPEPKSTEKQTVAGQTQPPAQMGRVPTQIIPASNTGTNNSFSGYKPAKMGPPGSNSAPTGSPGTVGRKPVPMDGPKPMDPNLAKKASAHTAGTKDLLKWQPGGIDNEFAKTLLKTKSLEKTMAKMPPDHFKKNFGWSGAQNAAQLVKDPSMMGKVKDYLTQQNPIVAQMLGKAKNTIVAGARYEGIVLKESPSEPFAKISAAYMKYQAKPADHAAASEFVNTLSREKSKVLDPVEKQVLAAIEKENMGNATKTVDSTTRATAFGSGAVAGKSLVSAGKKVDGRLIREDDKEEKDKKKDAKKKEEPEEKDLGTSVKDTPTEDDVESGVAPGPQDPGGLDAEETPAPEEPVAAPEQPKGEEAVVSDRLSGQTIKNASVELKAHGGAITLELVGTKIPAVLSWDSSGKVVFTFKNRPYILRRA